MMRIEGRAQAPLGAVGEGAGAGGRQGKVTLRGVLLLGALRTSPRLRSRTGRPGALRARERPGGITVTSGGSAQST